jgi:surface carbohydrate biosynthesis protein
MKHYFSAEALVASISADLASNLGLEFIVLGKRPSWQVAELDFYESVLSKQKWSFQAQTSEIANYQFVQPHDILVNIDSTFGYEMFGRGIRVAFASCRMAHSGNPNLPDGNFGFPLIDNPRGRYWTNSDDREEISRIIHWVASTELSEWHRVSQNEREKTMVFDPANKLFSDLLDSTGLLNRGPRFLEASRVITK